MSNKIQKIPRLEDAMQYFEEASSVLLDLNERLANTRICAKFSSSDALLLDAKLNKSTMSSQNTWQQDFSIREELNSKQSLMQGGMYNYLLDFSNKFSNLTSFYASIILHLARLYLKSYEAKNAALFYTQRLPKIGLDSLLCFDRLLDSCIITCNTNIYKIKLLDENKNLLCKQDLEKILQTIMQEKPTKSNAFFACSYLGSSNAASFLQDFLKKGNNQAKYEDFLGSIFCINIANSSINTDYYDYALLNKSLAFWPYKSLNFILFDDFHAALNVSKLWGNCVNELLTSFCDLEDKNADKKTMSLVNMKSICFCYDKEDLAKLENINKDYNGLYGGFKGSVKEYDKTPCKDVDFISCLGIAYAQKKTDSRVKSIRFRYLRQNNEISFYVQTKEMQDFLASMALSGHDESSFIKARDEFDRILQITKDGQAFTPYLQALKTMNNDDLEIDYFYDSFAYKALLEDYIKVYALDDKIECLKGFYQTPLTPTQLIIGYKIKANKISFYFSYPKDKADFVDDFKNALSQFINHIC